MKIFIARTPDDPPGSFKDIANFFKSRPHNRVFIIGQLGYDWELVTMYHLDGLVKAPEEIKKLLREDD